MLTLHFVVGKATSAVLVTPPWLAESHQRIVYRFLLSVTIVCWVSEYVIKIGFCLIPDPNKGQG